MEQDLKLRNIYDALNKPETQKEDIITFLMALQKQNFVLGNSIKYICRAGYKNDKTRDLEKAIHYLQNELAHEQNLNNAIK